MKTSFETTFNTGANYADFIGANAFGSIFSDRRSFTKEVEVQSIDCNVSSSDSSDNEICFNFEPEVPSPTEAMHETVRIPEQREIVKPVAEKSPTGELYKTPNYKGKKRSNVNYETKHNTNDIKTHEETMKKKYGVKLSVRKDVVNKTLFRSLKRYYTDLFMEQFSLTKKESSESYMVKIRTFCTKLFNEKLINVVQEGLTHSQVEKFLSILISPNHIKDLLTEADDMTLHKEYYSCLYQYSHKKLAKMLVNPVCGYLFTEFITSGNLTQFISTCTTMNQNAEVYESAGKSFLMIIMGQDAKAIKGASSMRASQSVV